MRPAIDRLGVADDARNRPEPGRHAQRAGVGVVGKRPVEHARVEFERLAIEVEKRARKARPEQRRAERHARQKQLVDERVLGAAQGQRVEPRGGEERARVARAGMRRIEHQRRDQARRLDHLERRLNVRVGPPAWLVHRASIRIFPPPSAAGNFIIIALSAYPPTPTRIKSRRLHPIFTRREAIIVALQGTFDECVG